MSVEALAIALHHSRAKGAAKLVLLGIANHDGDGGSWPSMATLARYAGVTPDQARKLVRKLEDLREVRVLRQEGGTQHTPDHMRPNLYEFKLTCPADCDGTTRHRNRGTLPLPQFTGLSTPPADSLSPIGANTPTPYPDRRAEPSLPTKQVHRESHVGNRARAKATHTTSQGKPCPGEMIDDRHCSLGCLIPTGENDGDQ